MKAGAGTNGLEFLFAALPLALTQATMSPLRGGGAVSAGQLFAVPTERARARERSMRRLHHTPHHPYQGGEEPPGPVRTAPAERRPKPDSVSENIIPPSTTLSVSRRRRAARSGQDRPRGAKAEGRQREREQNPAQNQNPAQTQTRKSKPYKNQTPRESPPKPTQTTGPHKRLVASRNSVGTVHARLTFGAEKSSHKQPLGGHCHMVFPAPSVKCLCGEERCLWNSD